MIARVPWMLTLALLLLGGGLTLAAGQEHDDAHGGSHAEADSARPAAPAPVTHGIAREPRAGDTSHGIVRDAKESQRARARRVPEGAVELAAPSSAEAVAAAVAKAMKAVDEKRTSQTRPAPRAPARPRTAPRRRVLTWPERRAVVRWGGQAPSDSVELTWSELPVEVAETPDRP